ncbi:SDR family NAD(P)-dependent oxidoreductase [Acinetobacter sp. ANC 4173]|uniref:SDR family NAD(P)-dependent oxidoreductase n=1 Tax=Acinetobacter sp. ANC 4173 TaxID=2529837 RepID=UPI00103EBD5C|nr:SDR family NAD(P)-dependent oxidoreductase [Acinetobacter sp. ANC 4173]TCB73341.1 SDR family oxidoreductase [Acinetobacter sp. ANC 4173]
MTDQTLNDRVAIVTGAAGSIGREICFKLMREGANLVLVDLDEKACQKVQDEISALGGKAIIVIGNVCEEAFAEEVKQQSIDHFGRIDILVNNAGKGSAMKPIWEIDYSDWEQDIKLNLGSQFLMCKIMIPPMIAQSYGRIVNIASSAGMEGHALSGGYAAAKAGVITLTKTLGKELAKSGVIINAIAPALIETKMLQQPWFSIEVKQSLLDRIPMGRLGQPHEVAEMVNFLVSDKVSFSTGAVFDLSGGRATY